MDVVPLSPSPSMDVEQEIPRSSSRYVGPSPMNLEQTYVTLFQLPLNDRDIARFRTPIRQGFASGAPMNCGAVSGSLLGILTSEETEHLTQQGIEAPSAYAEGWVAYLNRLVEKPGFYEVRQTGWTEIYNDLIQNHGTIVLGTRGEDIGHYFVVRRTSLGELEILDPQSKTMYTGMPSIEGYLAETGLTTEPLAFFSREPQTQQQINDLFVNYFLSNSLVKCRITGGQKKRQTRRKKRHTRKMTRAKRKDERKPKSRNK